MRKKSHELQWLEVLNKRNGLTEDEMKNYKRLKTGYKGELEVDKLCDFYLKDPDVILDDVTLKYQMNTAQIDKMIMIENTLYVVDIKNYYGHYVFENNEWRVGKNILSNNIYEQLRRATRVVKNILLQGDLKLDVQGVLVFINPESSIKVIDQVLEETLTYDQVPRWLMELQLKNVRKVSEEWKNLMKTHSIETYRTKRICDNERFKMLKKGIGCLKCGGFDIKENWYKIDCRCGYSEARETAYVRTICEYGVIMHHKDLNRKELRCFFSNSHDRYLKLMFYKHFQLKIKNNRRSSYFNKGEIFDYLFSKKRDYFKSIEDRVNWKQRY